MPASTRPTLPRHLDLTGRVAVVSGAGSPTGIGFATALALGGLGASVLVTATTDRIHARVAELRRAGVQADGAVTRLDAEEDVAAFAASWTTEPTILVNNAGMVATGEDMPGGDIGIGLAAWEAGLRQNLTSAFLLTRAVVSGMRRAGWGRVVNVSSVTGPVNIQGNFIGTTTTGNGDININEPIAIHHSDDAVLVEANLYGTHDGPFRGLPPTHNSFVMRFMAVFVFEEDRLVCERVYFDAITILSQLGIAASPVDGLPLFVPRHDRP